MPGWGKPLYEMKEAEIPKGDIPTAFDWRDKGGYCDLTEMKNILLVPWCLHMFSNLRFENFSVPKNCF